MSEAFFRAEDGKIRDFTNEEIAAMQIETTDIRQGGFPTETASPRQGVTRRATYFCKYDMYERFKAYMLGAAATWDDSGDLKITRMLPQTWPGKPRIACIEVNPANGHKFIEDAGYLPYEGVEEEEEELELLVPQYDRMKCVLTFQSLPYDLKSDGEITSEKERYVQILPSTAEIAYLNLPGGAMNYIRDDDLGPTGGDVVPIPYGIGFPVATLNISRKWHRVPWGCWGEGSPLHQRVYGNIQSGTKGWVGTCNVDTLFGYPPGYLLYVGTEEEIDYDPLGDDLCWNLTHKWIARSCAPHNWMYFWSGKAADAAANGWYLAVKKGASYSTIEMLPDETGLFNTRQHNLLFRTY